MLETAMRAEHKRAATRTYTDHADERHQQKAYPKILKAAKVIA
jgi:hypothetical protein